MALCFLKLGVKGTTASLAATLHYAEHLLSILLCYSFNMMVKMLEEYPFGNPEMQNHAGESCSFSLFPHVRLGKAEQG